MVIEWQTTNNFFKHSSGVLEINKTVKAEKILIKWQT